MTTQRIEVDLDIHSDLYKDHMDEVGSRLRELNPVVWTEQYGGHWAFTSHTAVRTGLQNPGVSSEKIIEPGGKVRGGPMIPAGAEGAYRLIPHETEPPEWNDYRKLLNRHFAPAAIDAQSDVIEKHCQSVIDGIIEKGSVDFVHEIASPVTALITLDILGLPLDKWQYYAGPIHRVSSLEPTPEGEPDIAEVDQELLQVAAERRANPEGGLIDELIATGMPGREMTNEEIRSIVLQLLFGGLDTTAGLLAGALIYLDEHRELHDRLRNDDDYLQSATEEFLRVISPVTALGRTATEGMEVAGQQIQVGDRCWFIYRSANRDPEVFVNPDEIDLERNPNRHFAFGSGRHRCLGSNLARAVFKVVLRSVLTRMPDYTVDHAQVIPYGNRSVNNGIAHMPLSFTPGEKLGS